MEAIRNRKSVKLDKEEMKAFRSIIRTFHTHTDAADHFGFMHSNQVLRILNNGCASPETIEKVRAKISVAAKVN